MSPPPSLPLLLLAALLLAAGARAASVGRAACGAAERCVPLTRCPSALQDMQLERPLRPRPCGFEDGTTRVPNVCCRGAVVEPPAKLACPEPAPPLSPVPDVTCEKFVNSLTDEDDARPGILARRMCRKHQEELCKLPQKLSVPACPANAEPADILEFPHMALLGYGDRDNIEYACGGSLIAADFILTAAHCANLAGRPVGWALLGATNRTSQQPKASDTFQLIQVAEVIVHPEYVVQFKYHDIALLRLVRPAVMRRDGVYPACLNTDMDVDNTGQDAVATGWGATSFADEGSQSLLKVNLTLREMQYCRDNIELDKAKVPRGLLDETQLCAGGGEHNRDTCQGDSGGPLQMRADPSNRVTCIYRIVGVVSFGPPCGLGKPGVYSRVAAYVPWIESVVWPTRPDGCVNNVLIKSGGDLEVRLPNTGPGTVARGMCRVFHTKFCGYYMASIRNVKPELTFDSACHHNHPRAERGSSTEDHDVVTFVYGDSPYNKRHNCAGALVSPNTVLTAARCVSMGCLPLKKVYVGPPNACSERGPAAVEKVTLHPDYREGRAYADLAVIKLKMSFDLRDFLPRCLNTMADVPVRAGLRATGASYNIIGTWEDMELDKPNSTLSVRSAEQCSAALLGNDRLRQALPRGYSPSLLCAGGLCDNETYAGDPGTPLVSFKHRLKAPQGDFYVDYVLGVASSLTYCTARGPGGLPLPDLFADVAQNIEWIEKAVWPDEAD